MGNILDEEKERNSDSSKDLEEKGEIITFKKKIRLKDNDYYQSKILNDGRIMQYGKKILYIYNKNNINLTDLIIKLDDIVDNNDYSLGFHIAYLNKFNHIIFFIEDIFYNNEYKYIKIIKLISDKEYSIIAKIKFKYNLYTSWCTEYSKGFIAIAAKDKILYLYIYENNNDSYQLIRKITHQIKNEINKFSIRNLDNEIIAFRHNNILTFFNLYKGNFLYDYKSPNLEILDVRGYSKNTILISGYYDEFTKDREEMIIIYEYKKRNEIKKIRHNLKCYYNNNILFVYKANIFIYFNKRRAIGIYIISDNRLKKIQEISQADSNALIFKDKYLYFDVGNTLCICEINF